MKTVIATNYKHPYALQRHEINRPEPKENEVLIKVLASSSNDSECLNPQNHNIRLQSRWKH